MINRSVRPLQVEVLVDKSGSLLIYGIHQPFKIPLSYAIGLQSAHLLVFLCIKKNTQSIIAVAQEVLRSTANDDAISRRRSCLRYLFCDPHDAICIHQLQAVQIQTPLETTSQDGFEEPIIQWVQAFFPDLHFALIAVRKPRNL